MRELPAKAIEAGLICAYDLDGQGGGTPLSWNEIRNTPIPAGTEGAAPVRWVHVDFSIPEGRKWLTRESGIDPRILEAMLQEDIRPRSLITANGILTVLRGVNLNAGSDAEDMVSIRVWVEKRRIISARRRRVMSVHEIEIELQLKEGPASPGGFLVHLISNLGDRIVDVVDNIDEAIENAEIKLADELPEITREQLSNLRRKTALIRRYLAPQREALDRLSRMTGDILSQDEMNALQEETNRMTQFVEELDLARERAMVAQEELLSTLAQEQNTKMLVLSMVAAVFLPLSFLTGLMGMNVAGLPGAEHPMAFGILVVLMFSVAGAILWLFRWKQWI